MVSLIYKLDQDLELCSGTVLPVQSNNSLKIAGHYFNLCILPKIETL